MKKLKCENCGAHLLTVSNDLYKCEICDEEYLLETLQDGNVRLIKIAEKNRDNVNLSDLVHKVCGKNVLANLKKSTRKSLIVLIISIASFLLFLTLYVFV